MRRVTASAVVVTVAVVGLMLGASAPGWSQAKEPITIGASMAYTGAFAGPAVQWATGWKDYLEQINAEMIHPQDVEHARLLELAPLRGREMLAERVYCWTAIGSYACPFHW